MAVRVSIVIPTRNRKELILKCLSHIYNQSYRDFEIVIIDDGSSDGTSDAIRAKYPQIIIIHNEKAAGPAKARNQGIRKTAGEYIWFLDSDSVVSHDSLKNMVTIMDNDHAIGCVGGELLKENEQQYLRIDKEENSYKQPIGPQNELRLLTVRSVASCNLLSRKHLLMQVGGFDESFFYMSEDLDLCKRIARLGFRTVCDISAAVLHEYSKEERRSNLYRLYKNEIRCAIKNDGLYRGFLLEPVRIIRNSLAANKAIAKNRSELRITKKQKKYSRTETAVNAIFSLLLAYLWNISHYFAIVSSRKKKYL